MTKYDYIVIGFYLVFMAGLGPVYKGFSKTASDYFRCGGGMLWWIVGSSAFMTAFSAWSFTGGAARAYETGTFFLLLFLGNIVGLLFTYFFTAARYRQMRIVTAIEGVRKRFGNVNEQVFTWLPVPFNIVMGGFALYTVSVFMHSVFGIDIVILIVTLGIVVTMMTLIGGAWAATAGDFVQMLVVLSITVLMAILTLNHPDIGGLTALIDKMPKHHLDWTLFDRPSIIFFFGLTLMINQLVQNNSMFFGAAKYVFVKDGPDAKKATLLSIVGFVLLPAIWIIPAVAATIIHPDLASQYPELGEQANSAAYVAMAVTLLPKGLLGLLVCGIFAASVTSMNSLINVAAGTFVRNFYIRIVNKGASEERQILVGRIFIFVYGLAWIIVAMILKDHKDLKLFDLLLLLAASIQIPITVPLFLGIFIKRTPAWAGWSTMLVGFIASLSVMMMFKYIPPAELFPRLFSSETAFNDQELADMKIATTTAVLFFITVAWFLGTMLFYRKASSQYTRQVDNFFKEMNTSVDRAVEHGPDYDNDSRQYGVLGNLCLIYGGFVLLLLLIPNGWGGRLSIMFCGGLIAGIGLFLKSLSWKNQVKAKSTP